MLKVTKAVFPVAGLGTRFLPATKASPKEMLPVVDKPLIQYAVEEAMAAGITEMIFVTGRSKRAIEDHFDKSYEIEAELEALEDTHLARVRLFVLLDPEVGSSNRELSDHHTPRFVFETLQLNRAERGLVVLDGPRRIGD